MAEQKINIAKEETSQEILSKVDTEVANILTDIGPTNATGGSATAGTVMGKLNKLISDLASHISSWTSTRAGYIDTIKANTDRLTSARVTKIDNIGATGDTGGSTTAGTLMGKLNALLTSWTSTRAGYIDNIRSYTVTNNTASKTGVLSAKLAYVISLLENTTYGLSAIKSAISSSSGGIKSVQRGTTYLEGYNVDITISAVNLSKSFINIYGPGGNSSNSSLTSNDQVSGLLTSTTNLSLSTSTYRVYVYWEVIEFK